MIAPIRSGSMSQTQNLSLAMNSRLASSPITIRLWMCLGSGTGVVVGGTACHSEGFLNLAVSGSHAVSR